MWRSKKCWMPNLEGWGWLLWFDFFDDVVFEEEVDDDLGFFRGGIGDVAHTQGFLQLSVCESERVFYMTLSLSLRDFPPKHTAKEKLESRNNIIQRKIKYIAVCL